ncbi:HD family phosphohydrolase [Paenibacillus yonginensis]|uniref:HD family phosphohydrolase n=1 Tax=Paenibacillus yonginensis TaxID=1462996 RepID=A0A1B1N4N5_9BACL|nr:HD-GYP domain-containing protein [Paenibacillus yonginensis]ANS76408.1 HD family phosphohydrolase [Paenibacillus yonginensis]
MGNVAVTDLKPGQKIASPVHTMLGGMLMPKGKVLIPRDLDVLRAFMIQEVEVEGGAGSEATAVKESKGAASPKSTVPKVVPEAVKKMPADPFQTEYDRMLNLVKSSFQSALAASIPVYDLRSQLELLLGMMKHYKILTFVPRNMNEYDYMYHNGILSALTSYCLAQWSGLPQKDWVQVALAGLLHDIGNAKVDPGILYHPSYLNNDELEEVRMHTTYGYQMLRNIPALNEGVRLAALQHHEKIDGSGYPLRLTGDKIHVYAKIVAVADIFHAMTLKKRYRKAQSPYLVLEEIQSEAFGKLDPAIVQTFIGKVTELHNGTRVRLNNDETGEIVFTDRAHPTRPMVSVKGQIINLVQNHNLYIVEIIN